MTTATAPVKSAAASPQPVSDSTRQMLEGPLAATLLRLATPNIVGLFAMTLTIGYDGFILGRLGADALAGVALVLPLSMLMLQISAGSIGGTTTAAVARALGGGDAELASRVAQHALLIAIAGAALFSTADLLWGERLFAAMGGRGGAFDEARAYASVIFGGAIAVWAANVLAGIVRGTGNMLLASAALIGTALLHVVLCPLLVFGWDNWQGWGAAGAAASLVLSNLAAAIAMAVALSRPGATVHLARYPLRLRKSLFAQILKVGLPASLNPIISNASITLATAWMASFGTVAVAGYGVAARLEYILVPIAFGFGGALTAMVATNMGAGQVQRALRATWAGAGMVLLVTGSIGLAAAIWPAAWMNLFTTDPAIRDAGAQYLRIVGGCYGFFGLGLALFFASQGAGRMGWPLLASSMRLAVVALGGWLCLHVLHAPPAALFAVVALSFGVYAGTLALAVKLGGWERVR